MVTSQEMRLFALESLRWSDETDNASQRDLMMRIAKSWMATASTLEHRADTDRDVLADLRDKLD